MTLPVVESSVTSDETDRSTTTLTLNLPGSIASGETLLAFITQDDEAGGGITFPAGWTELYDADEGGSAIVGAAAWRKADGTEGATISVTVGDDQLSAVVYRISGAADPTVTPPEFEYNLSTTLADDIYPPFLLPSAKTQDDYLFLAILHQNTYGPTVNTFPENFTGTGSIDSDAVSGNGCATHYCHWAVQAPSCKPTRWDMSTNVTNIPVTLVVYPATSAAPAADYPFIESLEVSDDTDRSGTTFSLKLPPVINAGELLLAFITVDNQGADQFTWPSDWSEEYDETISSAVCGSGAWKKATGSEGSTISVVMAGAEEVSGVVFCISGGVDPDLQAPDFASYATAVGRTHNPPSLTPPGGAVETLYLAIDHRNKYPNGDWEFSANHVGTGVVMSGGASGSETAWSMRQHAAGTEDPYRFYIGGSTGGILMTVGVASGTAVAQNGRVSRAAALALVVPPGAPARASRGAALVLVEQETEARITRAAALVLAPTIPCTPKRCQVWKITRTDGTEFRYTTTDTEVTWRGEVYSPCGSLSATAAEATILNAVGGGDLEVSGLISASGITESDMANGLFDGATVEIWAIPWDDPTLASDFPRRINKGVLGETSQNHVNYQAEIFTMSAKLSQQPLLQVFTAACRFQPGDDSCPLDLDAYKYTGAVETVPERLAINRQSYRQFSDTQLTGGDSSSGGYPSGSDPLSSIGYDGFWVGGTVTWITGNNAGISSEVKNYSQQQVTLWRPMPYEIEVGDQYEITPGCNLTAADHTDKFGLPMASFGGFDDLPGLDSVIRGLR